ncbi:hypothetical protein [Lysinibacillus fusiformis]|uniref:hypothetical protein n=1 Tax=Lysinibacillus fusiformis TaxID=28031 RepID=UPI001882C0E7|nr:hypothetical protein [Lysinibacillus fusiformis]MBD8523727.1 hypothetical protein [Lysinibacillus fusiformis]
MSKVETASVPQPVNPVEPKPSGAIDIIRTVEQGIVKYRDRRIIQSCPNASTTND